MSVTVRALVDGDHAAWRRLFRDYGVFYETHFADDVLDQVWAKLRAGDGVHALVAEVDGEVVGFAGVGPGRDPGYELGRELYFIYVVPEHRRGAIGKALLKQADVDYLWIAEHNRAAQVFYRKQKFYPDSVRRVGALFGAELPEIRMAR